MARVKTGMTTRSRHKKVLKMAKGYFGAKSVRFRMANQAVMKSLQYQQDAIKELVDKTITLLRLQGNRKQMWYLRKEEALWS